jgi:hypothetical protein
MIKRKVGENFYPIPVTHQRIRFYLIRINVKILLSKLSYKLFHPHFAKKTTKFKSWINMRDDLSFCKNS